MNWRSIWAPPTKPLAWGALDAIAISAGYQEDVRQQAAAAFDLEQTPFGALNHVEREAVLSASALYEILECAPDSPTRTIRQAYLSRAKENHPDAHVEDPEAAAEAMVALNRAWEVLGDDRLRAAYDFKLSAME